MKRILIISVESLDVNLMELTGGPDYLYRPIFMANLVFVKTKTHFRCVKNRWDDVSAPDEKIPNSLLAEYILTYEGFFTKEELIECIAT
jgi:hypothetical protein